MSDEGICPLCIDADNGELARKARAAHGPLHLFPLAPSSTLRRSLCNNAVLVL